MDGLNPVTLFTNNLDHVEFLTVDVRENKLYWAVTSTGMVGVRRPSSVIVTPLCGRHVEGSISDLDHIFVMTVGRSSVEILTEATASPSSQVCLTPGASLSIKTTSSSRTATLR